MPCPVFLARQSRSLVSSLSRGAYERASPSREILAPPALKPTRYDLLSLILSVCRNHLIPKLKLAFFLPSRFTVAPPFGSPPTKCWNLEARVAVATLCGTPARL